ncbi:hypothetical protein ABN028_19485 [Actinopolymorpha sp. B17G11]|uniref:hypothetical protein n=1 Tax=Actinopolymorpha sp. B17G11 TaxID=3160861 RepID=UPI0032E3DD9B
MLQTAAIAGLTTAALLTLAIGYGNPPPKAPTLKRAATALLALACFAACLQVIRLGWAPDIGHWFAIAGCMHVFALGRLVPAVWRAVNPDRDADDPDGAATPPGEPLRTPETPTQPVPAWKAKAAARAAAYDPTKNDPAEYEAR